MRLSRVKGFLSLFVLIASLYAAYTVRDLWAAPAETVITNCNEAGLNAALTTGGVISFNCGTTTITLSAPKMITGNVTLNGGNRITLSGGDAIRLFRVQKGGQLTLNQIALRKGFSNVGGAIYNEGEVTITESILAENSVEGTGASGGAIFNGPGALLTIAATEFVDNFSDDKAAGIDNVNGTVILDDVLFQDQIAAGNSAIQNNGTMTIRNSTLRENSAAADYGGAIGQVGGTLTIFDSVITENISANHGGGIAVMDGKVTIENGEISSNTGVYGGGGVYSSPNAAANVTIRNSRILNNFSTAQISDPNIYGGGIENGNTLTLDRVTISGNQSGGGAGLMSFGLGLLTLRNSTINNNQATDVAGGVWLAGGDGYSLVNVTVSGNSAGSYGGGVLVDDESSFLNVTLVGNSALDGANLHNRGSVILQNTILASPVNGSNCATGQLGGAPTAITSKGDNIASDASCGLAGSGDQSQTNPVLGPLADNGGPTQTHLPQNNSPAIDQGAACPEEDQRGFARTVGPACDIGATEAGASAPVAGGVPTATNTPLPTPTATATTTPSVPGPENAALPIQPADLPQGVGVTINVNPAQAPAGSTITVSGKGAPGSNQVRLMSVIQRQSVGIQLANVDGNGNYAAQVSIGDYYEAGMVQICALPLGFENAEVACTNLTILPAANGSVRGAAILPPVAVASAELYRGEFRLTDAAGKVAYSTRITPTQEGQAPFYVPNVKPDKYRYEVVGILPGYIETGMVEVKPLKESNVTLPASEQCGVAELKRPTTPISANPSRANFTRKYNHGGGLLPSFTDTTIPFGLYIKGVNTPVTFTATPQSLGAVDRVIFEFRGLDNQLIQSIPVNSPPYSISYDVGTLPLSQGNRHPSIYATPVVNGVPQCASGYDIEVIPSPFSSSFFQAFPNTRVGWDGAINAYRFFGTLPNMQGVLPARQDLGELPLYGAVYNELNTGISAAGTINLEGKARIEIVRAFASAVLLGHNFLSDADERLTEEGYISPEFDIRDPRKLTIPFHATFLNKPLVPIAATKALVFSYFGIVNGYVNGRVVLGAGLVLEGQIQPLVPALDMTLTGTGSLGAELGVSADVLFGLVEGGFSIGGAICINLPLRVIAAAQLHYGLNDPTVGGKLYVTYWASALWGLFETSDTATIADFGAGCGLIAQTADAMQEEMQEEIRAPQFSSAPVVAAASNGRLLSAYVENSAAAGQSEKLQIMARFQEPNSSEWSAPQAISNPAHSSQSPTVAFVGPNQTPVIAWTENTLTAEQAKALGNNFNAHTRHLEIYYALWQGNSWSAPIALTNDLLAEGLPEVAGSLSGGVLAWSRDLDGDFVTRADQRIAVSLFDTATNRFGPPDLLSGPAVNSSAGLNNDVSVAYDTSVTPAVPYLAWVQDLDGNLQSGDDRRLVVAYRPQTDWVLLNPQPLPPRVDSPAIAAGADGITLAFLMREATAADGRVAVVGVNGVLWVAHYKNRVWSAQPVVDNNGKHIYAEQPEIERVADEALLLFRRFGDENTTSNLGQISLSRIVPNTPPSPPLYLTDAPEQKWMASIAINPITKRATILNSTLALRAGGQASAASLTSIASTQAMAETNVVQLAGASNVVEALSIGAGADPALDPLLTSSLAPAPGSQLFVGVTIRNVGRGTATKMTVTLYGGSSANGTPLGTKGVEGTLAFNETRTVYFTITAQAGEFPLFAQLSTSGENLATGNDGALVVLGKLSTPTRVAASASDDFVNGLQLIWSGNSGEYVAGYRILRGASTSGPWELVGESAVPTFVDTLVERGKSYCYAIQAHNLNTFSAQGPAACAELPLLPDVPPGPLYLPSIGRR